MKKFSLLFFLLLLLPPVSSHPYWLKEGVYVKYAVLVPENVTSKERYANNVFIRLDLISDEAYEKLKPVLIEEEIDCEKNKEFNKIYNITCSYSRMSKTVLNLFPREAFLSFTVVNITNTTALIRTSLEMKDVIVDMNYHVDSLNLSALLILDLNRSAYIDEKGNIIGKPVFFIDIPPARDDLLLKFDTKGIHTSGDLRVANVSYGEYANQSILTYVRNFTPPYITVRSNRLMMGWEGFSGVFFNNVVYDFSSGLMISGDFVISPELMAMGVISAFPFDLVAFEHQKALIEKGVKTERWLQGFNLYETNIKFEEREKIELPQSKMRYFFAFASILLLMALIKKFMGERE
ncbi:MAG: hypothetical protein J7K57_02515 [Palaeococcus sp.]|uniref:hypothetical protein n=1 Tax=Palaeococcus sp. (in: euryarchaeotes) TaxID=2820298 RepID=UPI002600E98D|nr:hypothetical protein [Palaeococcus sp. (in: euryarchaeotes)]MCD6558739.1 hypothetical protein [Palaeococcus sp. (in: euryarchaeotes)]